MIFGFKSVSDVAVVVGFERNLFVEDGLLVDGEFFEDVFLNGWMDLAGGSFSDVLDGELIRLLSISPDQFKEPRLANAQDRLDVFSFDFLMEIPLKQFFDLNIGKTLVDVSHILEPSCKVPEYGVLGVSTFKL